MSLSRVKVWTAEILQPTDLNAEFDNILNAINATAFVLQNGQLQFPATQNPSADVNCLDDYEEGTWTPVDSSGASLVFSSVTGVYTKVGNVVTVYASLTFPATADATSSLIGGLPFTSANSGAGFLLTALAGGGGGVSVVAFVIKNTKTFSLNTGDAAARTNANNSGRSIIVTGQYFV